MANKKLSIVIPAYNEEAGLAHCLGYVEQGIKGYEDVVEVVVVNNASTDRTKEIALGFPFVNVVDEERKGLVRARQAGFVNSTGELIGNIDADSQLPVGWVAKVLMEFENDSKLVALSGPYIYYDLSPAVNFLSKFFYAIGLAVVWFDQLFFKKGAMLQGGNFILRRTALEAIGGYRVDLFDFYGEETDVAMRIEKVGKVKWTFSLPMETSGRRLKTEGTIRIALRYGINYLWPIIFGRPYTKVNKDLRQ
ncbi:MAG: glycosyltransferase [Candidatus Paceibacterota bacterium]|jgi:glycosyltransferase involved in cell wall biosynthesis